MEAFLYWMQNYHTQITTVYTKECGLHFHLLQNQVNDTFVIRNTEWKEIERWRINRYRQHVVP